MQKITPFLWFDGNAEEAVNYYTSVFSDSKIIAMTRYSEGAPYPKGTVMTIAFSLFGQEFTALNGGPQFKFTEATSFVVRCKNQQEVDHYWDKLSRRGEKQMCGWLKDQYGLSWQIVPDRMIELLSGNDSGKAGRVMQAMMQMDKIQISKLEEAAEVVPAR
jgi:predicted 3-demethylubiquinone-9 3-methyltransferase (glyoxalase superfamily)